MNETTTTEKKKTSEERKAEYRRIADAHKAKLRITEAKIKKIEQQEQARERKFRTHQLVRIASWIFSENQVQKSGISAAQIFTAIQANNNPEAMRLLVEHIKKNYQQPQAATAENNQ